MAATSGNILDTIGALYDSLTKTEKRIATTVLSSRVVGTKLFSGNCTTIRCRRSNLYSFCRTLGFKGFTDFKLQLSIELATKDRQSNSLLETDISKFDGTSQIAEKLQNVIHNVISETVNLLDFAQLEKVVELMRVSKRIFLFGVGSSGLTAEEAKNKLMRIGLHVDATSNNHFMYMQAALMNSSDIVIGISHSGYSKETVQALNIAKKNGAVTVALTHNLRSPITMVSDYVLINGNRQGQLQGDSIGTKIAQLLYWT